MDLMSYLVCVLLAGAAGGVAGWGTVRRMLGGPRAGGTMRGWPGPGGSHVEPPPQRAVRRLGRVRDPGRRRRRWWW